MNQATEIVFMEFDGGRALKNFDFDGDVKYHAGYSSIKKFADGSSCNVLLAALLQMKGTLDCIPLGGQQSLRRASYSVPHGSVFHLPGTDFEVLSARAPVKHFPLFQSSALTSPITYSVVCKD